MDKNIEIKRIDYGMQEISYDDSGKLRKTGYNKRLELMLELAFKNHWEILAHFDMDGEISKIHKIIIDIEGHDIE